MRVVFFMVVAALAVIVLGVAMGAGFFYIAEGKGLHPAIAGPLALLALWAGYHASGVVVDGEGEEA